MSDKKWSAGWALTIGITTLFILVGGFGAWAVKAQITGAIVSTGKIEVDQNRQIVQHPDGGVVQDILVEEGDTVEEGAILIKLDDTLLGSELTIIEGQLFEMMARRARLEAERDSDLGVDFDDELMALAKDNLDVRDQMAGQVRLFLARADSVQKEIEQLGKRRNQITDQIIGIDAQMDAMSIQLDLIHQELENQQTLLEKGLAQIARVLNLQREEAKLSGTVGELTAQRAQAEGRITELEIEVLKIESQRREEAITRLRDLQFQELELAEQRRSLQERLSRLDVRAPVSGIVYGMQVFAKRSVIRPADPVLYLVPQDKPLVIMAQVEPIHIDELYINQEVSVRFSALDSRTTPELFGRVTQVSADAFEDENTAFSYYRAEIELNEGETDRLPEGTILIPGMPVEAYMRTNDRSPLEYLIKPLADYFAKALRES
ncbi:MAG: HlyD family type I secretion periplasmic adaptor subunit [Paracoccaceae bacterium]|nr:HlyD family type I secretion periplasmic adaptor subunit [Paracoccaceae bacterium]MDG2258089.1 HlyD family type I secretion periplasmic adaptor subunit [Paracoccaceae bacterium]